MKRIFEACIGLSLLFVAATVFSQVPPAPVASPAAVIAPVVVAPVVASVGVLGFIKANLAALALAVYALLDVVIIAVPSLAGNGLVHELLILAGKASGQTPPSA